MARGRTPKCTVAACRGLDGQPVGVFNTRDVSERKAAELAILQTQDATALAPGTAARGRGVWPARSAAPHSNFSRCSKSRGMVARNPKVEYSGVSELQDDGSKLRIQAAVGWPAGGIIDAVENHTPVTHWFPISRSSLRISVARARFKRLPRGPGARRYIRYRRGNWRQRQSLWGAGRPFTTKPRKFSPDDAAFMQAIANIIAQAVERSVGAGVAPQRGLFSHSDPGQFSDTILVLKPDGTITFSSDSVREFGRDQESYIGTNGMEFVHPDDHEAVRRGLSRGAGERALRNTSCAFAMKTEGGGSARPGTLSPTTPKARR